jgi:hypothetical protein
MKKKIIIKKIRTKLDIKKNEIKWYGENWKTKSTIKGIKRKNSN